MFCIVAQVLSIYPYCKCAYTWLGNHIYLTHSRIIYHFAGTCCYLQDCAHRQLPFCSWWTITCWCVKNQDYISWGNMCLPLKLGILYWSWWDKENIFRKRCSGVDTEGSGLSFHLSFSPYKQHSFIIKSSKNVYLAVIKERWKNI